MYFNFITKVLDGIELPYMINAHIAEQQTKGFYSIECRKYPAIFTFDETTKQYKLISGTLWEGWNNYPNYSFNLTRYEQGADPFEPFEYHNFERFKKSQRRVEINRAIKQDHLIQIETELKLLRKALMSVIKNSKLKDDPDIQAFKSYSNYLEDVIARYPKDEFVKIIDLKKINGKKES